MDEAEFRTKWVSAWRWLSNLLGGFQGVSLQASWVRVLGRSGTQMQMQTYAHTHTHSLVLEVVSAGRDTELLFVSQQSPLMCSSILHAAVPFHFLFSVHTHKASWGKCPRYLMCSAHVELPDSIWTELIPNQGPARMQHQTACKTLLLEANLICVCTCVWNICTEICKSYSVVNSQWQKSLLEIKQKNQGSSRAVNVNSTCK